jgi:SAM-dependent methyltransferase
VSDLPVELDRPLAARLAAALDVEGKIPRALDALGPIAGRDVVLVGAGEAQRRRIGSLGGRLTDVESLTAGAAGAGSGGLPSESADAVVSVWSAFRGVDKAELAEAERVLRPDGRLLIVHDYGRDDVSRVLGDQPAYSVWSRRDGPFLTSGFRIRVVHCWWTFESIDEAAGFLGDAFGDAGRAVGETLARPRLSYNVAVYHRTRGDGAG